MLRDKLLHGVSVLSLKELCSNNHILRRQKRLLFDCGYAALCSSVATWFTSIDGAGGAQNSHDRCAAATFSRCTRSVRSRELSPLTRTSVTSAACPHTYSKYAGT